MATLPKLRSVDVRPIVQDGRVSLVLRDPLQLSDRMVVIPRELGPLLALCDGTRDAGALRASLAVRFGLRLRPGLVERLLQALDEAFLLENERFVQARQRALDEYRRAPFRPPILAGQSYPADPDELRRFLDRYLDAVPAADIEPGLDGCRGLICPHIDYPRGGPVYARVWKPVAEAVRAAELVVLLGTDHFGPDRLVTLTRQDYATPFGPLPTARPVVDALAAALDGEAGAFAGELYHRSEHSIELAAVWLHHVRGGRPCQLVPILCGSFASFVERAAASDGADDPGRDPALGALVDALRGALDGRRALVVAAADLSHVGPAFGGQPQGLVERARMQAADEALIEHMRAGDAGGFFSAVAGEGDRYNVCGLPPIYLALRALDPVRGEPVAYDRCPADQNNASWVSICGVLFR